MHTVTPSQNEAGILERNTRGRRRETVDGDEGAADKQVIIQVNLPGDLKHDHTMAVGKGFPEATRTRIVEICHGNDGPSGSSRRRPTKSFVGEHRRRRHGQG